MGRPSDYTDEIAQEICGRIAQGENLRQICSDNDDLPCERTIYRWLANDEAFCQQYARARRFWADAQVEEIVAIARDDSRSSDHKRLEIDTRKWAAGKLNGKYSDKVKHVGGDDGDNPIAFTGWQITFGT